MHNRRVGAKGLVFGGLMAALVAVFAVIPGLGVFMPVPLVLAYVRFGGRTAVLTAVVAVLLALMFTDPVQTFGFLVPGGILPGLAFGYGFRTRLKPLIIGVIAFAVIVLGFAGTYVITRTVVMNGRDPIATMAESPDFKQLIVPLLDSTETYYKNLKEKNPTQQAQIDPLIAQIEEYRQNPAAVTWTLLPSGVLVIGVFSTWLNYMLCRWILPRFGHEVPLPTPFAEFRLPSWSVWVFMIAMYGETFVGGSVLKGTWWMKLVANVFPPLSWVFVLVGTAVAYGWLRKSEITKPLAVAIVVGGLVLFGPGVGIQLYILLAILDTIFDFRGLGHGIWKRPNNA